MIPVLPFPLSSLDLAALAVLLLAWLGSGWAIEHPPRGRMSVTLLMQGYRRDWMVEMTTRQPRIFDATILSSLRQGTTFLTSAAMISVGGVLALAGNAERLDGVVMGVGLDGPSPEIQQLRLAIVALLLVYAAFKFVWSNRLFGYCAVVMASVPNDPRNANALPRAAKAAELNVRAALNFNRGLRAVYFAFAALAWLLGPWGLMAAVAVTTWTVLSREFASTSRGVLMED
ncbi:DUF599 domain-containing protein [Jannaschia formosa]|uniref:DUF599 domain-containing protein n=1 Tax=Jannaschia formosa TaxID=2259592 RepID=UPI000E1BE9A3|nr:DUF599 domain-containing protein [Jannaschia formosa]TFL16478.1 DUF599 domain-containing protein [Jannaschia formosa]